MTHVLICPHCGQPDEENIGLARQLPQGQKAYLYCGRCGGGYYLIKTTALKVETDGDE